MKKRRGSHRRERDGGARGKARGGAEPPGHVLPAGFVARVLADLGPHEGEELLASLRGPAQLGLRLDSRLGEPLDVMRRLGWSAEPLPWSPEGVLLHGGASAHEHAGRAQGPSRSGHPAASHPWHDAGAYYLQDPAAMGVVPVLDPRPGELILDLAAAPGGKSTYVADRLQGSGLLWSHDVDASRVGTLVGNLERWGAANVVVSHGPVARLAPLYGTFDRVLLDAPCSGEGMFRKSRAALDLWSPGRVAEFVAVQARLLDEAVELLKPGGVLVYATCTFGADEDEAAIDALLGRRDDVAPQTITVPGASGGLASYAGVAGLLSSVARWWPQRQPGEGHFVACLRKTTDHGSAAAPERARSAMLPGAEPSRPELAALEAFQSDVLGGAPVTTGPVRRFGDWLHALPAVDLPRALGQGGLAPRRVGLPLGRLAHGRFEPHHALSHALPSRGDAGARLDLDAHDPRVSAYLRGEVIAAEGDAVVDGWLVVRASGLPLGWARAKRGELNNHYPKGLRRG